MNLTVDYLGNNGIREQQIHYLTRIGFVKHLTIADQRFAPSLKNLIKTFAKVFQYSPFLKNESFGANGFVLPQNIYFDPFLRSTFYNYAGMAIADFLSKRIGQSILTILYRDPRIRPSLYPKILMCFSNQYAFAINTNSNPNINLVEGIFPQNLNDQNFLNLNYIVSTSTYNLIAQVQSNYHCTWLNDLMYDTILLRNLSSKYYEGFLEFLNNKNFIRRVIQVQNEEFYEVDILSDKNIFDPDCFQFHCPLKLILPFNLREMAEQGIPKEIKPFVFVPSKKEEEKIYIDYDRIGLSMF